MLTLANRTDFTTLLDAVTLTEADERPAIIYTATGEPPVVVSRAAFLARVRHYAGALAELGLGRDDLVIIAHTQSLESVYLFWACLLRGAVPSMFPTLTEKLDPGVYMANLGELIRLSAVAAVLTTDEFAREIGPKVACPVYGSAALSDLRPTATIHSPASPAPDSVAFLQHSSGTTGLQKGVALSHMAVLNQIAAYSDAIALTTDDVVVSWLPLYHDMGLIAGFMMPLFQGVPLVLMSPFDWVQHPALLLRAIDEFKGTLSWLPNFAYNHMARRIRKRDSEHLSLASMRLFVNCSEPVRHDSHALFLERFAANGVRAEALGVSYAMAENTFAVTQTVPGRPATVDVIDQRELDTTGHARPTSPDSPTAQQRVTCGPPIPNTAVRIVGPDGETLPERMAGEVAIRSDCMLSGYYRRPELQPLQDGWLMTGDIGYLAGGELYVAGRSKDLIINAGKNIFPQDIEAVVNGVNGVHTGRAVVFGVPDEREGTELVAVVAEVRTDDVDERHDIGKAIRLAVASQMEVTASYVHLVGPRWLLKTSSGKIARAANRDKWLAETGRR